MGPKDRSESWIPRALADLKRQIQELQASISKGFNGSISQGGLTVNGGGSINVTGGGKVTVDGLALSAVQSAANSAEGVGWELTTDATTVATCSVDIPDGFTQAIVQLYASGSAYLEGDQIDYFYLGGSVAVTGMADNEWGAGALACQGNGGTSPIAGSCYPNQNFSQNLHYTGLSGGTITATVDVHAQGNDYPAEPSNGAWINLLAIFLP